MSQAVDLEDLRPWGQVADDVLGVARGHQILAVHAGQETRLGVELGEGDRVDAVGVQHGAVLSGIGSRGGGGASAAGWERWPPDWRAVDAMRWEGCAMSMRRRRGQL